MPLTQVQSGMMDSTAQYYSFKNRIINGAMVIDQRNVVATINSGSFTFATDRFAGFGQATDGVFTLQRSTVAPTNFTNSLLATVTTADASIGSTQLYGLMHRIEGFNTADFNWGSANAVAITLSFWVRSSVTGTFGGALLNNGQTRSYAFTYTISAANTWEQKTVTIAGDTSGTWATNNSVGVEIQWSLGCGASLLATAGAWNNAAFYGATGQTNLISTNGATFYITGVQLEKGSTATSFDVRPYGTELALCQRYYYRCATRSMGLAINASTLYNLSLAFPVTMRSVPTLDASGNSFEVQTGSAGVVGIYNQAGLRTTADAACVHNNGGNNWTTNTGVCISAGFSAEL